MTKEDAKKLLKYPVYKWSLEWDDRDDGLSYCDAIVLAISALEEQIERERNEPLTLDELRKMDGEPVWVKAKHYGAYADVVHITGKDDGDCFVRFKINYRLYENGCGKTWLAYRHKPKEK